MNELPAITDARGVRLRMAPPQRIVSLVPSTTETLFALGLGERVVGLTRFCVRPEGARSGRVLVGGTKDLDQGRLRDLRPDLVIGNAEENSREIFEAVEAEFPLYVAFPRTVDDAVADLRNMGALLGVADRAAALAARVEAARAALRPRAFTYVYLIWRRPYMAAGQDTFIASMLGELGGRNLLEGRYPEVSVDALAAADRVLLSSEPFPFQEKHIDALVAAGLARERVRLIDGQACSWHGVRMIEAFGALGAAALGVAGAEG